MTDDCENNVDSKQMYEQLDADLEATIFPELRELAGMPDATTDDMHNVCNYLYWAQVNW